MVRHVIAPVDELPPGTRKFLTIDERPIAIFNIKGEFFGLLNRCPHQGAALCEGPLIGLAQSSDPGEIEYTKLGEIIRCPWHGWEFDVRTGQSWCDPARVRARRYAVSVQPGTQLIPGPYVAETVAGHGRGRLRGGRGLTPFRQPLACPPSSLRPDVKARQMKKAERIIATSPGDR